VIWLLSAVNVAFLLGLVVALFGGWRLFVAWRGGPGPR
jgi:hypothetical protein